MDKTMSPILYFWSRFAMKGMPYKTTSYMSFVQNGGWLGEAKYIGRVRPNHLMEIYFN